MDGGCVRINIPFRKQLEKKIPKIITTSEIKKRIRIIIESVYRRRIIISNNN
jgi:hypothetical protein